MAVSLSIPAFAKDVARALAVRIRHPDARLGRGTYVQSGVRLARHTVAGERCAILRGAEIQPGTELGTKVVVGAHSRIGRSKIGDHCTLEPEVEVYASTLAHHVSLQRGTSLTDTRIGRCTYIAREACLNLVSVGSFCSIGPGLLAGTGDHPSDFGSTSPVFYSTRRQCGMTFASNDAFTERQPILIGHDVWIGAHVFVRDGISIGNGAIVAAGAIVAHDVPPYAIVGGTPARVIRFRFSESVIARLLRIAWWNWPGSKLAAAQPLLASRDIEKFLAWAEAAATPTAEPACP